MRTRCFILLFGIGWALALWDLYETILNAGDTPWRLHHGWIGLALVMISFIIISREVRVLLKKTIRSNEGQIGLVLALFQIWLVFITALDHLVHHTLYDFGLQFSYEWADVYWVLLSLIWASTVLLAVSSYWIGRTPTLRNKVTAFRIGFTFFGEWVGSFLDTLFFVLEGRIPAETVIWWWNPFFRLFGIPWRTSTQYTYNLIWVLMIVAVWLSSDLVRNKIRRCLT